MLKKSRSKVCRETWEGYSSILGVTSWCWMVCIKAQREKRHLLLAHPHPPTLGVSHVFQGWWVSFCRYRLLKENDFKDWRFLILWNVEFWLPSHADLYWRVFGQMPVSFVVGSLFPVFVMLWEQSEECELTPFPLFPWVTLRPAGGCAERHRLPGTPRYFQVLPGHWPWSIDLKLSTLTSWVKGKAFPLTLRPVNAPSARQVNVFFPRGFRLAVAPPLRFSCNRCWWEMCQVKGRVETLQAVFTELATRPHPPPFLFF